MTSLLLLGTVILVTWLCIWAMDEKPTPPGVWCPFEMKGVGTSDKEQLPAPSELPARAGRPALPVARPSERPWARRSRSEGSWKRRSGS